MKSERYALFSTRILGGLRVFSPEFARRKNGIAEVTPVIILVKVLLKAWITKLCGDTGIGHVIFTFQNALKARFKRVSLRVF